MTARWWALGTWALVAASLLYWGLRLFAPATPVPPHTTVASAGAGPRGDLTRLFGMDAAPVTQAPEEEPPPPEASRFQLVGVVAPRGGSVTQGVALISVDGQAPKAYRVGATVDGDTVLQSVRQREATLGPRGQRGQMTLEIPPLEPAATGSLPPAVSGANGGMPAPAPQPPNLQGIPQPQAVIRPAPGYMPGGVVRPPQPMMPGQVGNAPRALPQPQHSNDQAETE